VELAAAPPGSVPGDVTRALARLIAVLLRDEPGPEQPATPAEASP
jgi:hypothetical protein